MIDIKKIILLAFIFGWGLLIYHPSLYLRFSLVDDGLTAKVSREITSAVRNGNMFEVRNSLFEPQYGRVRPVYWLTQTLLMHISGFNPHSNHFVRLLILTITMFIVRQILKRAGISFFGSVFVIFLFLTNSQNIENYYRLGPGEAFIGLYFVSIILLSMMSPSKRKILALIGLSLLGSLTKETFFLTALPIFIFIPLLKVVKKPTYKLPLDKFSLSLSGITLLFLGLLIFMIKGTYPSVSTYASGYQVNLNLMLNNLLVYFKSILTYQPLFSQLALLFYIIFLIYNYRTRFRKINLQFILLSFLWLNLTFQLLILLPWKDTLGRYLILVNLTFIIIYAITLDGIYRFEFNFVKKINQSFLVYNSILIIVVLSLLSLKMISINAVEIANYQLWQQLDDKFVSTLLTSLKHNIPKNATVFVNYKTGDSNLEIYEETTWHLQEFYQRKDIAFKYLTQESLCADKERYILDRTADRFLSPHLFKNTNFYLVDKYNDTYKPLNFEAVRKSFLTGEKNPKWNNSYVYDWSLYLQKPKSCINSL